ncbi:CYP20A [Mytilus coruscus]|uniref:CYP20A n=1 Tax=Mytilus coruscus TaxID=42192 RepID=A0A6J8AFG4_MYTCO|nr:CYP20A [Mytilus coruscus]
MLDFAIFAVTFVGGLIAVVIYLYPGSSKPSSIPGPDPTTKEDGNLADIKRAGSLHEFLLDIHKQYGPIASFWMGQQFVASVASADLFKEHQNVFDRPPELFKLFKILIGPKSIQYANKQDGRTRRKNYDEALTHDAIKKYYETFQITANDLSKKFSSLVKEEHIALSQYMSAYALKIVLLTLMGDTFKDDKEVLEFRRLYDIAWSEIEKQLTDMPEPNSQRMKTFNDAKDKLYKIIKRTLEHRKKNPAKKGEFLLIDILIENCQDEETLLADTFTFIVGGFHSTGYLLTWCFYFLATHQDIQDKVQKEIKSVLGSDDVDHTNINDLVYLRQVIDETLRCAVIAPWAARFQDFDSELGGHKIPKNTPVIHALGVTQQDEALWPVPNRFDPDRFSEENSKKRQSLAFQPFGFAGKRICPGYRFAYAEATVCFVTLLRKFKFNMVEGQVITPVHGLVTHPSEEVWITIDKR